MEMMFRKNLLFYGLSLWFLNLFQISSCFSLIGSKLKDLQDESDPRFELDANEWKLSIPDNKDKTISLCKGTPLLRAHHNENSGDGGVYLQRVYHSLPQHNLIDFSLLVWVAGEWDSTQDHLLELSFDSILPENLNFEHYTTENTSCDPTQWIRLFKVSGTVSHSALSLHLKVYSRAHMKFGFRDIEMTFITELPTSFKHENRNLESVHRPNIPERVLLTCDPSCLTCTGTTSNDCASCLPGSFLEILGPGVKFCSPIFYPQFKDFINYVVLTPPDVAEKPSLAVLVNTMEYVKYLDMEMPPALERLAIGKGRPILTLRYGFHMPESMIAHFVRYPVDFVFLKHNLHSNFLVNYWQELMSLAIFIVAALISTVLEKICKKMKWSIAGAVFEAFRIMTRWNVCVIFLATSFGDIILFGSLEFRTFYHSFESSLTYVSFFIFIITIIVITCLLAWIVIIARKAQAAMSVGLQDLTCFARVRQDFQVLYTSFNWNNIIGRLFFLVYMVRLGLPMLFAAYVYVSPLAGVIIQLLINIAIIGIVGYFRPLKRKINMVQILLFETMTLVMNICMLVLTILSVYKTPAGSSFDSLGDVVVIGNVLLNLLLLVFLLAKLIIGVRVLLRLKHLPTEEKVILWLQLLFLVLQQGAMGFESVFEGPELVLQDQFSQYLGNSTLNNTSNMGLNNSSMQVYQRNRVVPAPVSDRKTKSGRYTNRNTNRNTNRSFDNSNLASIEMRDSFGQNSLSPQTFRNQKARPQKEIIPRGLQPCLKYPTSPQKGKKDLSAESKPHEGSFTAMSVNFTESPILYQDGLSPPARVAFTHREHSEINIGPIIYNEENQVVPYTEWVARRGSNNKLLDLYYSTMKNRNGHLASNGRAFRAELENQPQHSSSSSKIYPWKY